MHRITQFAAISVLLGGTFTFAGQSTFIRPDGSTISSSQIDKTVNQLMTNAHVTGAGIAIFHDRKIVFMKAYGLRDVEKGLPLTPDSVMASASLSKAAFATLVMRLVQEHILNLDKPIYQYLPKPLPKYPQYEDLAGDDRYKLLTLRILLSHTSGFPNSRGYEDDHKLRIHFEPGTRYAYSGEGISLAQMVVETVTGKSIQTLLDEKLFRPLGMTRSSMVWEPRFENDFANGYDEYGRSLGPEKWTSANAAGTMQTTLRDYATFLNALLRSKPLAIDTLVMLRSPPSTSMNTGPSSIYTT